MEKVGSVSVKNCKRTRRTVAGNTRTVWEVAAYTQGARRGLGFKDNVATHAEAKRGVKVILSGNAAGADLTNREAENLGRALELIRPTSAPTELVAAYHDEAFKILDGGRIVGAAKEFTRLNPTGRPRRTIAEVATELIELKTNRKAGPRYIEALETRLDTIGKRLISVNVDSIASADI